MIKKGLVLLLALPFSLFAENLAQLIALSKNNKMVDSSAQMVQSTIDTYESTKGAYLPNLIVGAKYQITNNETSNTPDNALAIYGKLSYTIYDGGKRGSTYDSLESSIKGSKEKLKNTKNVIALQITNYYYNYLALLSQKKAKVKEIEQLDAQQKRLERFLEAGTTTDDEVQKIISRVQSANVSLHEIELNIQTILHNLEYIIGRPVTISKGSNIKEYVSKEQELRSDIKALEYDMQAGLYSAKSKKGANYPTLIISDTYTRYDNNFETNKYKAYSDEYDQNVIALSLTWNVFDFGMTSKSYESAYKKYLALKSQYEYEKNKASVDFRLAQRAYEISKLKIKSAQAGLKAANSAYKSIKAKYQNGLVDNVSYLEALSEKYGAQSALKSVLYDFEIKKANVIYHSGKDLQEYIN